MRFVVCLEALPYPFRGYRLTAKRVPKSEKRIWDWLSPGVVKHVFVEAKNVEQAKAVGLKEFVEEAEDAKTLLPIMSSQESAVCASTDGISPVLENRIMLKGGRIIEIPDRYKKVNEVFDWLRSNCGNDPDFLISKLEVFIPEINKTVHFLESNNGLLISTTTFPKKAFRKLKGKYPFIEPAYVK